MRGRPLLGVLLVVIVLIAAACGGGSSKSGPKPAAESTQLGRGVTANEVKVGVALPDFACIMQFRDQIRVKQPETYQAFFDYFNKNGGGGGRQMKPAFDVFCPIPTAQNLAPVCPHFADDEKVFAVIGNIYDPSGQTAACLAKQNDTILQLFLLTQSIAAKAPPGMIVFPGTFPERRIGVMTQLLDKNHTLEGKKLGILGEPGTKAAVEKTLIPAMQKINVQLGTTGILAVSGADTTSPQQQLDSLIERWKSEHVDAVFLTGDQASAKQFVEKIKKAMPTVMLLTDNTDTESDGQGEKTAGVTPNPYEGLISAGSPTPHERIDSENWKKCAAIWKEQTGQDAPNADAVIPYPGDSKKTLDTYHQIEDACEQVTIFKEILDRVGTNLNTQNWVKTVNSFGPITDPSTDRASLGQGKYDTNDSFRLQQFDSNVGPQGGFKSFGDAVYTSS